jgi:hypothetical protein
MGNSMRFRIWLLTVLLSSQSLSVFGQTPAASGTESTQLSFLEPGRAYLVRFPPDRELFQHTITGTAEVTERSASGEKKNAEQRPFTARVRLDVFKVVGLGGGSWVLMEHPASSEDYARWTGKHRAMAILSLTKTPEPKSDPDAQDRLKQLREAAARDIPTTKTWINLDHAITISELSARSLGIDSDD